MSLVPKIASKMIHTKGKREGSVAKMKRKKKKLNNIRKYNRR